ncbi:MAG: hypothetical protein KBA57_08440 [Sphingomonadaceae bacterium]|nr:hypothetical protein [Sphingomonadaceae bacterium]
MSGQWEGELCGFFRLVQRLWLLIAAVPSGSSTHSADVVGVGRSGKSPSRSKSAGADVYSDGLGLPALLDSSPSLILSANLAKLACSVTIAERTYVATTSLDGALHKKCLEPSPARLRRFKIRGKQSPGGAMLDFLHSYSKETFALVGVIFAFVLNRVFRLRPKLIYSVRHSSNYVVDQPLLDDQGKVIQHQQLVRTASIVAQNTGLQAGKNVEFTFNWKPPIYNVYPGRAFSTYTTEMNRWVLKLDSLAPGEQFAIEILSINQDLPLISAMRCDDASGKLIDMVPQRVFPTWFNVLVVAEMLAGFATTLYLFALLIEWLAR